MRRCDDCGGAGIVPALGSWGEDGPPASEVCRRCRGTGYLPRVAWWDWLALRQRLADWWWRFTGRIADALRRGPGDRGV